MTKTISKGVLSPSRLAAASLGLLAAAGCASASKGDKDPEALARTIDALRAQNATYTRQIEELQNRLFIAQDQLDSHKVASEQKAAPNLPVVTLSPYGNEDTYYPAGDDVEYAGDAARTSTVRPVVKLEGKETPFLADQKPTVAVLPNPIRTGAEAERAARVEIKGEAARAPSLAGVPALKPGSAPSRSLPPAAVAAASPSPPDDDAARAAKPAKVAMLPPAHVTANVKVVRPPAEKPQVVAAAPKPAAPKPLVTPESSPAEAPDPAPLRLYREALDHLKAHQHAEAVAGFRQFVKENPHHDYADNAQYWLGECFYDLKDHRSAVREFRQVVERFPEGNKVPDALLKTGYSYLALGEVAAGKQALGEVVRAYPKHEAARLAELKLKELDHAATAAATPSPPAAQPATEVR